MRVLFAMKIVSAAVVAVQLALMVLWFKSELKRMEQQKRQWAATDAAVALMLSNTKETLEMKSFEPLKIRLRHLANYAWFNAQVFKEAFYAIEELEARIADLSFRRDELCNEVRRLSTRNADIVKRNGELTTQILDIDAIINPGSND